MIFLGHSCSHHFSVFPKIITEVIDHQFLQQSSQCRIIDGLSSLKKSVKDYILYHFGNTSLLQNKNKLTMHIAYRF